MTTALDLIQQARAHGATVLASRSGGIAITSGDRMPDALRHSLYAHAYEVNIAINEPRLRRAMRLPDEQRDKHAGAFVECLDGYEAAMAAKAKSLTDEEKVNGAPRR